MLSGYLLLAHEIHHGLYEELMEDYMELPTMATMRDEVAGMDLVELMILQQNYRSLNTYLHFGPGCCLDMQEREWCKDFINGYLFLLHQEIERCQLVHSV